MARFLRGAVVALIAVLVGLGGALPSHAGIVPQPSPSDDVTSCVVPTGYPVPRTCTLNVQVLTPICDNEVPKLRYKVVAQGTPNTTVTITWVNPGGADVVYADLPLEGTVKWPGAVEDSTGRGIDWPGWTKLANGSWVEGDEFDWVRPSVQVNFKVNPEDTVSVGYPPSSPSCNTNPPGEEVLDSPDPSSTPGVAAPGEPNSEVLASNPTSAVLSATGSDAGPLAALGAALVVIGASAVALVAVARRRRSIS